MGSKDVFDDIDGDSDRFKGKVPTADEMIASFDELRKYREKDVRFMFAVVSVDKAGQTIQLFKRQKDAEAYLIKLKEYEIKKNR